jgi:hypothetical protein
MAFTIFDLHISAHEKVGTINYGISSASSGTTSLEDRTESSAHADDQFNGGIIYFIEATAASSVQGQFRRIGDYDASSGQYSWTTALPTSAPAGTVYGVATPEFNFSLMNRLAAAALRVVGPLVYSDRSMQSSANQLVYALSTVIGRSPPLRVDIQGRTGSSADNPNWTELYGWYIQPGAAGSAANIVFPRYLPAGRDIRIFYEADHTTVTASTALIDSRIHPELVTLALVEKMYEYRNSRARGAQEFDVQRWNDAKRQLAEARVRWPVWRPKRKPDILVIGGGGYSGSDDGGVSAPPWGSLE